MSIYFVCIYIYIYSHPQTDLFRSIRTHQCGLTLAPNGWHRNSVDSNAKPKLLTIQPRGAISCEVNFKRLWITITIVYIHQFNGYRDLNSFTKRLAMNALGNAITSSPENSTMYILCCRCSISIGLRSMLSNQSVHIYTHTHIPIYITVKARSRYDPCHY